MLRTQHIGSGKIAAHSPSSVFVYQGWRRARRQILDARAAHAGMPGMVVLAAPPASGKSFLLQRLAHVFRNQGETVRQVRGSMAAAVNSRHVLLIDDADRLDDVVLAPLIAAPPCFCVLAVTADAAARFAGAPVAPVIVSLEPMRPAEIIELARQLLTRGGAGPERAAEIAAGLAARPGCYPGPLGVLVDEQLAQGPAVDAAGIEAKAEAPDAEPVAAIAAAAEEQPRPAEPKAPEEGAMVAPAAIHEMDWVLFRRPLPHETREPVLAESARGSRGRLWTGLAIGAAGALIAAGFVLTVSRRQQEPHLTFIPPAPGAGPGTMGPRADAGGGLPAAAPAAAPVRVAPPPSPAPHLAHAALPGPLGTVELMDAHPALTPPEPVAALPDLPALAPPRVEVTFTRGDPAAERTAATLVRKLSGSHVAAVPHAVPAFAAAQPTIRYFFAEDRDSAVAVQRRLGWPAGSVGLAAGRRGAERRPGAVEITVSPGHDQVGPLAERQP